MHAWEAIQKTLDFIEGHLGEPLDIDPLAKLAALSPFYYQRLFSRLVQRPVQEYIKLRRLSGASKVLLESRDRILDIALRFGFRSHESFTRAFKDAYGMTPEQYRKAPVPLNQFDKPDLLLAYTMIDEGVPLIRDGLVLEMRRMTLKEPISFLGITGILPIAGQMPLGKATGVDLPWEIWARFHREKARIPRLPGGREVGVAYFGDAPEGCFTYLAGAEVALGTRMEGFVPWQMAPGDYVVCGFEAENFELLTTVALNKAIPYGQLWLKKHGLSMHAYSPEVYYDSSPEGCYMEIWMPIS